VLKQKAEKEKGHLEFFGNVGPLLWLDAQFELGLMQCFIHGTVVCISDLTVRTYMQEVVALITWILRDLKRFERRKRSKSIAGNGGVFSAPGVQMVWPEPDALNAHHFGLVG
jgi:hypothetical protein